MGVVSLIRQGVLGEWYAAEYKTLPTHVPVVTSLFSVVVLAISAHLISLTQQYYDATATFCALALAVAVISLVTLPVMLLVDFFRRDAFTSMIVVELAWLNILWILWVAAAGESDSEYNLFFLLGCNVYTNSILRGACQETQVVVAFSFINFIILLLYASFLCVMAVIAATRGRSVWLSSVKEHFNSATPAAEHPMTEYKVPTPGQQPAAQPQPTAEKTLPETAAVAV